MTGSGKSVCLDKTPAYALILPFMMKVYPDAKYVVLTRHPLATFSSFANSFFDGDYSVAHEHNPLLERYVPALAAFFRQREVPYFHVRYEDLVRDPETWMGKIYEYAGVEFERETIDYGERMPGEPRKGLGDPIGVQQHSRPTTASIEKWVDELSADAAKLNMMRGVIGRLDPADLELLGYPIDQLWNPLESASGVKSVVKRAPMSRYRLQRKLIVQLRAATRKSGLLRSLLRNVQLACDVLLRE
jgi:hypothetical protein